MEIAPGVTAAVPQRRIDWRLGRVVETIVETPRAKTLVLDVPGWPGHLSGQHVDVRLTAEDGYQAQRSYSIASPPEDPRRTEALTEAAAWFVAHSVGDAEVTAVERARLETAFLVERVRPRMEAEAARAAR